MAGVREQLDAQLSGLLPAGLRRRLGMWRPQHDMPDCLGRVYIVTGGASGVGFQITKRLLAHNATVILATHNMPSARKAVRDIQRDLPHVEEGAHVRLMFLDLTSFRSIDAFVAVFLATGLPLYGLCNCAGEAMGPPGAGADGRMPNHTLVTNYYGPFYLTHLLLQKLSGCAPARVVNVCSALGEWMGTVDWADLRWGGGRRAAGGGRRAAGGGRRAAGGGRRAAGGGRRAAGGGRRAAGGGRRAAGGGRRAAGGGRRAAGRGGGAVPGRSWGGRESAGTVGSGERLRSSDPLAAYNASKRMMSMFTRELAVRCRGTGVDVFAVHPGFAATQLWHKSLRSYPAARLFCWAEEWFAQHPYFGALPALCALTEPGLQGRSGLYLGPPLVCPLVLHTRTGDYWLGDSRKDAACTQLYDSTVKIIADIIAPQPA
ncbi:hypothetical protein HXX76_001808 [Chlamydomonas incerta]|uniref:Uncharacterized protein n=1 Tax=Chlamydomonas incerta TaxID=51695 RepID=A0A835TQA4_CHLIN|nr:hypothetical protein HXX76_001808 [Chlamydomonas incerta]|eukprot:KAG2443451.1 hypothetical protein HXX76_001808 [Chlamydomonas incerta]